MLGALTDVEVFALFRFIGESYDGTTDEDELPEVFVESPHFQSRVEYYGSITDLPATVYPQTLAIDAANYSDAIENAVIDAQEFIEESTRDDPSIEYSGFWLNDRSLPVAFAYFMSHGYGNWPYEADWGETVRTLGFHPKSRTSKTTKALFDKFVMHLDEHPEEEERLRIAQDTMIENDEKLRRIHDELPRLFARGYRAKKGVFDARVPQSLIDRVPAYLSTSSPIEQLVDHFEQLVESEPRYAGETNDDMHKALMYYMNYIDPSYRSSSE
jgi:hypothetical protein